MPINTNPVLWLLATLAGTVALDATAATALTQRVRERLHAQRVMELSDLGVETESDGTVWLSGRTYAQATADLAMPVARTTPGVTRVRSTILAAPETQR